MSYSNNNNSRNDMKFGVRSPGFNSFFNTHLKIFNSNTVIYKVVHNTVVLGIKYSNTSYTTQGALPSTSVPVSHPHPPSFRRHKIIYIAFVTTCIS